MKAFLLFILLAMSSASFGCVCIPPKFLEKYTQSDFVVRAKIVKNYKNAGSDNFYKADIEILDLYKGKHVNSIFIEGSSDGKNRSSCDIFFTESTELLIYAFKQDDGNYKFNSCSGYTILNGKGNKLEIREHEMLNTLRNLNLNYTNKIDVICNISEQLTKFRGIELNRSFAIYEITFGTDLQIKDIQTVAGFNKMLDEELTTILKNARWLSMDYTIPGSRNKNKVSNGTKLLFGIYFYPSESNDNSFLSDIDV